jgi:hypothetical protein
MTYEESLAALKKAFLFLGGGEEIDDTHIYFKHYTYDCGDYYDICRFVMEYWEEIARKTGCTLLSVKKNGRWWGLMNRTVLYQKDICSVEDSQEQAILSCISRAIDYQREHSILKLEFKEVLNGRRIYVSPETHLPEYWIVAKSSDEHLYYDDIVITPPDYCSVCQNKISDEELLVTTIFRYAAHKDCVVIKEEETI